jgi:plastocyanin
VTGDGAVLSGVTVRLFTSGGTTPIATANTAANGQATFGDVEAGAYDVEVVVLSGYELASGESSRKSVTVVAEQTATVTFALQEIVVLPTVGQVRARVVEGTTGVAGVEVMLFEDGGMTPLETLETGADGRVLFAALDPGAYEVEITVPEDYELAAGETSRKSASVTAGATTDVEFEVESTLEVVIITASGSQFSPETVTIAPGTTVRWVNGGGDHTVTPDGHTEWTSANLPSGTTFEHTFESVGEFDYFCIPHQSLGMTGTVTVQ